MCTPQVIEKRIGTAPLSGMVPLPHNVKGTAGAPEHTEHARGFEWVGLTRIAFVAVAAAAVWFHLWEPFSRFSVIGIAPL
jgi:hypothetical protein